jgi:methionyl-tRNA formyltransferase
VNSTKALRIAFAGDRDIAVQVLEFILEQGVQPLALLLSEETKASHAAQLLSLCSHLSPETIFYGKRFTTPQSMNVLKGLNLDYIIGVHFPYIVPANVLAIPRIGVLNLHPAYLPHNRGWHTPSWAILENTPAGSTLHFMDHGVDSGDVILQRELPISHGDTADTLYQRVKKLELEIFREAWPEILSLHPKRSVQNLQIGSQHRRQDLMDESVQRIDLDQQVKAADLIRRLRALTTNQISEAAYFEKDGKRYRIQVRIHEEEKNDG